MAIFTGDAQRLQTQQQDRNDWVGAFDQRRADWENLRNPYLALIKSKFQEAAAPGLNIGYGDAERRQAFAARSRGTRGGSADLDARMTNQQALATGLGQAEAGGERAAQGQQAQDFDYLQNLSLLVRGAAPGEGLTATAMTDASRARTGLTGQLSDLDTQQSLNNMRYQGAMSQVYGGQMTDLANIIRMLSQFGQGPAAVQRLGANLTGGAQ